MTVKGKTVAYLYDEELGNYSYGGGNPMRPHRVRLTHSLVENYGLGSRMIQHRPTWQTQDEISQFHADGAQHFVLRVIDGSLCMIRRLCGL